MNEQDYEIPIPMTMEILGLEEVFESSISQIDISLLDDGAIEYNVDTVNGEEIEISQVDIIHYITKVMESEEDEDGNVDIDEDVDVGILKKITLYYDNEDFGIIYKTQTDETKEYTELELRSASYTLIKELLFHLI